jgi:hypothetical protein
MNLKKFKKVMNFIIIVGKTKGGFWSRSKNFELTVYYTVGGKIMAIDSVGIDSTDKRLDIGFNVGDKSDLIFNWVDEKGHKIIFQKNIF